MHSTAAAEDTLGRPAPGTCRIPGCDGYFHDEDTCSVDVGELTFDDGSSLPVEYVAVGEGPAYVTAYGYITSHQLHRKMTDPAQIRDFAQQLRTLAGQLDQAANHLAQPADRQEKAA
ncbi:hypothetical protein ABZS83_05100 [Streptomyces sp. NPDC005426]|uniref:hypothetical protein n=1 Tax=Streptomyces sp. NPDC005426 TaxID=3155344 RepID=UPI0033BA7BDA